MPALGQEVNRRDKNDKILLELLTALPENQRELRSVFFGCRDQKDLGKLTLVSLEREKKMDIINLEPLLPEVVPDRVPEVQLCVARGGNVCQNGVRVRKREPLLALWVKRGPIRLNPNLWVMERHEVRSKDETRR